MPTMNFDDLVASLANIGPMHSMQSCASAGTAHLALAVAGDTACDQLYVTLSVACTAFA